MLIICQQSAVLQRFEWNNPDWIGYVATIEAAVNMLLYWQLICLLF